MPHNAILEYIDEAGNAIERAQDSPGCPAWAYQELERIAGELETVAACLSGAWHRSADHA